MREKILEEHIMLRRQNKWQHAQIAKTQHCLTAFVFLVVFTTAEKQSTSILELNLL
jgi:hypothetical protein